MSADLRARVGRSRRSLLAATAFLLLGGLAPAQAEDAGLRKSLSIRLHDRDGGSPARQPSLTDGRERAAFCAYCHGADGNSVKPFVPNLAGQNPFYLLDQIEKFADGRRQDYIMSPLARRFTTDDKIAIALYYANMSPHPKTGDPSLADEGGKIYRRKCVACHGMDAHGGERYARLAGQNAEYVRHRLNRFQTMDGTNAPVMTAVAKKLTDREIETVAVYLSTLP